MLRVLGRRADGYHRLQTVFQLIDRTDLLSFEVRRDGHVRRVSEVPGVPPESDLVVLAARLLQSHTGCPLGADIHIEKRLPLGGGLGGGSSDAATTLLALDALWQTRQGPDVLAALGLSLGADVPVFVRGLSAWGEGVGAELTPIELPRPWYLVLVPPCEVSTARVFSDPELTRNSASITISDFLAGDQRNDCLPVVRARYPAVADALDWLAGYGSARLTGTGACVFCPFEAEAPAREVLARVPGAYDAFVARGVNRSPVLDRLTG
jgi:4-diphosphocytidyl-2-C-methyl-D-erythritol kinase